MKQLVMKNFVLLIFILIPLGLSAQFHFANVFPIDSSAINSHGIVVDKFNNVWNAPYLSVLINGNTERINPAYIYDENGVQLDFSPIYGAEIDGEFVRFGPITGVNKGADGNIYVSVHGFRTTAAPTDAAPNPIIGNVWNQTKGYIYVLDATDGSLIERVDVTYMRTETAAHAPNRPAVTEDGYVALSFVFPASPIVILDPSDEWNVLNVITTDKTGFSRKLEITADGRKIFNPNTEPYTEGGAPGHIQVWEADDVFSEYTLGMPLAVGTDPGAIARYPTNPNLLFFSGAGTGNSPYGGSLFEPNRYYGVNINTGAIVSTFDWNYASEGDPYKTPRGLAFSDDGQTAYVTSFTQGPGAIQKFTLEGELNADAVSVRFMVNTATIPDTVRAGDIVQIRGSVKRAGDTEFRELDNYFGKSITWDDRSVKLNSIGGDYWSTSLSMAPGDELRYKLYTAKSVDGEMRDHTGGGWESVDDQFYTVAADAQGTIDVPLIYFNREAPFESRDGQVALFFRVNVGYQVEAELINENSKIGVRGTPSVFQNPEGWSSTNTYLSRVESPSSSKNVFYSGVVYVDESLASTEFEYKFVIENEGGSTLWEGGSNKVNRVGVSDTTLYFRYFNDQRPPLDDLVQANVEFLVNTSNLEYLGLFDPKIDEVSIPASFNGWDSNASIMSYNSQEGVWSKTLSFKELPGTNIDFKYFLIWDQSRYDENSPNYISNLPQYLANLYGWEESGVTGGNHRTYTYSSEPNQVANSRTTFFNSIPPEGIINETVNGAESIPVTFTVDMTDALMYSTPFNPVTDKLYITFETPVFILTQNLILDYRFQLLNEDYKDQIDRVELTAREGQLNMYSLTFDLALPTDNEFGFAITYVKPGDEIVSNSAETTAGRRYYRYIQPSFRTLDGNLIWPDSYEVAPIVWKAPTTLDFETPPDYDQLLSTLPIYVPPVRNEEFDIELTVTDALTNALSIYFGLKEDATSGYDADYDQFAPPSPPSGIFDVRILRDSEAYFKDFQPSSQQDVTWRVKIQPVSNSHPIVLSWDPEDLPEKGELIIRDAVTGNLFSYDMMSGSSVSIGADQAYLTEFIITYSQSRKIQIAKTYRSGWDLVGFPVTSSTRGYRDWFLGAIENSLFGFNGTYQNVSDLDPGKGYWLRFNSQSTVIFEGDPNPAVSFELRPGWNLISGPSESVAVSSIEDSDDIIIPGSIFGFNGSYVNATTIEPGRGYWVRTNQAGTITLQSGTVSKTVELHPSLALSGFDRIEFLSVSEEKPISTLYLNGSIRSPYSAINFELPPVPPVGNVDVRWEDGLYVSESAKAVALVQQGASPLVIKVPELFADEAQSGSNSGLVSIREFVGDQLINQVQIQRGELYTLSGQTNRIEFELQEKVDLPAEFTLDQNYPNPFNPTTTIRFGLPESADVSLEVYTVLGQKVMTLVNENRTAGWHTVSFNGAGLSSGVYVYRIQAGGMVQTRKLMLVK
jgi:hypothetical protein